MPGFFRFLLLFLLFHGSNSKANSTFLRRSMLGMIRPFHLRKDTYSSFEDLPDCVLQTHQYAQTAAIRAVNQFATLRNWLIGCYIVEYEQKGKDRAQYGERLLKRLEEKVNSRGLNETLFRVSRAFYLEYPQIRDLFDTEKRATVSHESEKRAMPSHKFMTPSERIN